MKELIYTVKVESGIGMKASGPLAVAANSYPCKIQFHKEGDSLRFDMKRVLSVASMSVKRGISWSSPSRERRKMRQWRRFRDCWKKMCKKGAGRPLFSYRHGSGEGVSQSSMASKSASSCSSSKRSATASYSSSSSIFSREGLPSSSSW